MHKLIKTGLVLIIICVIWFTNLRPQHDLDDFEKMASLNTPDIIKSYGYSVEEHVVLSPDGYLITLHRIPKNKNYIQCKGPILLHHAFLQSSTDFIIMGPENSVAFLLADSGYDVWLINQRGNYYSNKHISLSSESDEFWNFDIHDVSVQDVPAVIDYILQITNEQKLTYIGYSLGGLLPFIMLSEKPDYNMKLKMFIAIAPAVYISQYPGLAVYMMIYSGNFWKVLFEVFNVKNVYSRQPLLGYFVRTFFARSDFMQHNFFLFLKLFTGSYEYNFNKTLLPIIFGHTPAGTSRKLFVHLAQSCISGDSHRFDYRERNMEYYGLKSPPKHFKTESLYTKVVLFCGTEDNVIPCEGVERLYSQLPNVTDKRLFVLDNCTHLDVTYGINAKQQIYDGILQILDADL